MLAAMSSIACEISVQASGECPPSSSRAVPVAAPVPTGIEGLPNGDTGRERLPRWSAWEIPSPINEASNDVLTGVCTGSCGTNEFRSAISTSSLLEPVPRECSTSAAAEEEEDEEEGKEEASN